MFAHNRTRLYLVILALLLIVGAGVYAFAAANTVPPTYAGDGHGGISGYTVSAVHYVLDGTDPGQVNSVTFTTNIAPASGSTIKIKLVASGSTWYTCTNTGTAVTCTTTGATVTPADDLRVVIAD